jgi:putative ABC transport system substrate-binding protein
MKRREFIAGLGCGAAWRVVARAQQTDRMRRIGVLQPLQESDPVSQPWLSALITRLRELGWTVGQNLRMDVRWGAGNVDRMRVLAKELVDLQPDMILAHMTPVTAALQRETSTIPIVFVNVADPIGEGFVASLAHPGGNLSGFIYTEPEMASKWLELLLEIAPGLKRVALVYGPDAAPRGGAYYLPVFEAAARLFKVASIAAPVRTEDDIETVITSLARESGSGLLVMADAFMASHRPPVISLAARNSIPAIYADAAWVRDGGLLSYAPDISDIYRRGADYVDRILRGDKPADLPVQLPIKFEMAVSVKTARALGLTIPQSVLLRADEVIE